jgi:hypothetical protein
VTVAFTQSNRSGFVQPFDFQHNRRCLYPFLGRYVSLRFIAVPACGTFGLRQSIVPPPVPQGEASRGYNPLTIPELWNSTFGRLVVLVTCRASAGSFSGIIHFLFLISLHHNGYCVPALSRQLTDQHARNGLSR